MKDTAPAEMAAVMKIHPNRPNLTVRLIPNQNAETGTRRIAESEGIRREGIMRDGKESTIDIIIGVPLS